VPGIFLRSTVCAVSFFATAQTAAAAFVTINETALEAVYSQAAGFQRNIDFVVKSTIIYQAPGYSDLNTTEESNHLLDDPLPFMLAPVTTTVTTVTYEERGKGKKKEIVEVITETEVIEDPYYDVFYVFFVDTISVCGTFFSGGIVGCGSYPGAAPFSAPPATHGNRLFLESGYAAGSRGPELLAHELGHNMGLDHTTGGLMNASLNGSTLLTASEISSVENRLQLIFRCSNTLIGPDCADPNWVPTLKIQPVLIVESTAAVVPLPMSAVLLLTGLLGLSLPRGRKVVAG
jgi:hypothetical protein